jgi:hypothetical protein
MFMGCEMMFPKAFLEFASMLAKWQTQNPRILERGFCGVKQSAIHMKQS